jgi:hypothetical protein
MPRILFSKTIQHLQLKAAGCLRLRSLEVSGSDVGFVLFAIFDDVTLTDVFPSFDPLPIRRHWVAAPASRENPAVTAQSDYPRK